MAITPRRPGRSIIISDEDKTLLAKAIIRFSDEGWPLTFTLVQNFVEHYVKTFLPAAQQNVFKNGCPSRGWLESFIRRRPDLRMRCMQVMEDKRIEAITPTKVGEHIARVIAICKRFRIRHPCQIVNLDECGMSFDRMAGRSLRQGVTHSTRQRSVESVAVRTRGNLNHVTIMAVVGADGKAYKPVVVFPGKQPHYRRLEDGRTQTVHDFLPPSHVYHRDPAGVDTSIFLDFAKKFIEETEYIRADGRFMALVLDGYSSHIQPEVLSLLRDNRVICIALPSHSSHRLQPLDVSVFAPYKAALKAELHKVSRHTRVIDVFAAAECISFAYNTAVNFSNIVKGFEQTGLWVRRAGGPSAEPLTNLFMDKGQKISVEKLMRSFDKSTRGLVFGANVVTAGTVRVDTSTGVNLSSDAVLGALLLRDERRKKKQAGPSKPSPFMRRANAQRKRRSEENVDISLAPERKVRRELLDSSRSIRRERRRSSASIRRAAKALVQ